MNGLMTILVGAILVSNLFLILYLFMDKNKSAASNKIQEEGNSEVTRSKKSCDSEVDTDSIIAESKFDVELFASQIGEKLMAELPRMFTAAIGDVTLSQIEFATEDHGHDNPVSVPKNNDDPINPQLSIQEMTDAFDTDIRDVDDIEPSAPVSSGATIDELEAAVSVAMDDSSSDEAKSKAGDVLRDLQGTELYDRLSEFDEIGERVDFCVRMSIRTQISAEYRKKNSPKTEAKKAGLDKPSSPPLKKSGQKTSAINLDNVSLDDFDPESLLTD